MRELTAHMTSIFTTTPTVSLHQQFFNYENLLIDTEGNSILYKSNKILDNS